MSKAVELNVGGVGYVTTIETLTSIKDSLLTSYFKEDSDLTLIKDSQGRYFVDRDGILFRYILDYMRNRRLILPENFSEKERLKYEAEYFRLPDMIKILNLKGGSQLPPMAKIQSPATHTPITRSTSSNNSELADRIGSITVGYRGTFAFGRDGLADVKFRKVNRILVCGKVTLCRSVFGETLNESRDPDRGDSERYTARFFLKHGFIEQAFDMLLESGFKLKAACGTGTNSMPVEGMNSSVIPPQPKGAAPITTPESEEGRWYHYNEFVWIKEDADNEASFNNK